MQIEQDIGWGSTGRCPPAIGGEGVQICGVGSLYGRLCTGKTKR